MEYMSPEQVQGAHVDGRSDVFSTACVLCELVTGRRPFHADSLVAILYKIANEQPQLELPAGREYEQLRPLLERALARDPQERFPNAAEFAAALRAYARALGAGEPAAEAPAPALAETAAFTVPHVPPPAQPAPPPPVSAAPVPPTPVPRSEAPPIDPAELFRLMREIYMGGKSGHLHFTHGPARRSLRFVGGHIVMGTSDVPGEHLGNVLVRFGLLSQAQLEKATEILLRDRKRLGTVLAELGIVPRERMTEAVGLHVREILFNVMGQGGGSCGFEETGADSILGPDLTVRIAPGEIILEATRRIQDPQVIARVVGSIDRLLALSTHPLLRMQKIPLTPDRRLPALPRRRHAHARARCSSSSRCRTRTSSGASSGCSARARWSTRRRRAGPLARLGRAAAAGRPRSGSRTRPRVPKNASRSRRRVRKNASRSRRRGPLRPPRGPPPTHPRARAPTPARPAASCRASARRWKTCAA